jgi:hypothetical protein
MITDTLKHLQNLKIDIAVSAIVKNIPDYEWLDLVDKIAYPISKNKCTYIVRI